MKKLFAFISVILLLASSTTYAFDFIKLGTGHDEGFWGVPNTGGVPVPSAVEYLAARNKFQTNPLGSLEVTDQDVQDALAGDFGPFDALLFSEDIQSLTPETYALINDYVSAGGCVVVTGSHESEQGFLNSSFGYSIGIQSVDDLTPFSIQLGANGTPFEGGPPNLLAANATQSYSNTPGQTIYSGDEGVVVFTDKLGQGNVTAIGWDYCCTPPEAAGSISDWFEVINRAFDLCSPFEPITRNIPTLSEWGLIAMGGILGIIGLLAIRRRKETA